MLPGICERAPMRKHSRSSCGRQFRSVRCSEVLKSRDSCDNEIEKRLIFTIFYNFHHTQYRDFTSEGYCRLSAKVCSRIGCHVFRGSIDSGLPPARNRVVCSIERFDWEVFMPKTAFQLNLKKPPEDAAVKTHNRWHGLAAPRRKT
jgi:hypothetical protein